MEVCVKNKSIYSHTRTRTLRHHVNKQQLANGLSSMLMIWQPAEMVAKSVSVKTKKKQFDK